MISLEDIMAFSEEEENSVKRITFDEYQRQAVVTAIYPLTTSILYPALGLAGEAGEVANKVKKIIRDGTFDRAGIAAELGDCLWYIAVLARDLNIDLNVIARENLLKLNKRKKEGKLNGSGDTR